MLDQKHILIVDDDKEILELLKTLLTHQGFKISTACDASELNHYLQSDNADNIYHLILLDVNLPDGDGIHLSRTITDSHPHIPIMLMTAQGRDEDHVLGLEYGADDYIQKPFNVRTLTARINVTLRRRAGGEQKHTPHPNTSHTVYSFAHWTLDKETGTLMDKSCVKAPLTKRLYDILNLMLENPNRILSRDFLAQAAEDYGIESFDRAVDLQISRLRNIIEVDPSQPAIIKTVRGFGYNFAIPVIKK